MEKTHACVVKIGKVASWHFGDVFAQRALEPAAAIDEAIVRIHVRLAAIAANNFTIGHRNVLEKNELK